MRGLTREVRGYVLLRCADALRELRKLAPCRSALGDPERSTTRQATDHAAGAQTRETRGFPLLPSQRGFPFVLRDLFTKIKHVSVGACLYSFLASLLAVFTQISAPTVSMCSFCIETPAHIRGIFSLPHSHYCMYVRFLRRNVSTYTNTLTTFSRKISIHSLALMLSIGLFGEFPRTSFNDSQSTL